MIMKKILTGLMSIMGLMGFWSCDKIEPEDYTIYNGAVITWTATTSSLTPVQRALVEKYTGPRCVNCPNADETLDAAHHQFGDKLVVIAINHPTGQGLPYPNQPDMRTTAGTTWDQYFGINAIPAAYLNRDRATQYQGSMSNISNDINTALQGAPMVAIEATAQTDGSKVNVEMQVELVQSYDNPLTITVALTEDSLAYKQLTPDNGVVDDYQHHHMLRAVATSYWGADVEMASAGSAAKGTLTFDLPEGCNPNHCNVVVFVSDKSSRRVLNSYQTGVMES
jgi:hypothetical protein